MRPLVREAVQISAATARKARKEEELAKEAQEGDRGVVELLLEKKLLTRQRIDELLDPKRMV